MHVVGQAETHRIFSPRHSRNSTYQAEDWKTEFWEIQPGQKERTEDTDTGVHLPSRFVKFKNKNKNKKYPTYTLTISAQAFISAPTFTSFISSLINFFPIPSSFSHCDALLGRKLLKLWWSVLRLQEARLLQPLLQFLLLLVPCTLPEIRDGTTPPDLSFCSQICLLSFPVNSCWLFWDVLR